MFLFLSMACNPDPKTEETDETGEVTDTSETGDTDDTDDTRDTGPVPAVEYSYTPTETFMFAEPCVDVDVPGKGSRSVDVDSDGVIDCGREDEGGAAQDITLTTSLKGAVIDEHDLTRAELSGAVEAVVGKVYANGGTTTVQDTCNAVCDAMSTPFRKGTCPEFKGKAVAASENALTTAMNTVETNLSSSLGISLNGAWCFVSTRSADLSVSTVAQSPQNIWWGVIYGLKNYSAGSLVYDNDGSPVAVYSLTYKVPGKVATTYNNFLNAPLTYVNTSGTATYPTGTSFTLTRIAAQYSTDGVTSTSGAWPSWWASAMGTGIIDPDFDTKGATELEALDAFIGAQAADPDEDQQPFVLFDADDTECPSSLDFPNQGTPSLKGDATANNESIVLDEACVEK